MIYLISQLWIWLLLTLVFAAIAGWAYAVERATPQQRANRRDRENLLSDILRLSGEAPTGEGLLQDQREIDGVRRQLDIRDGRIAELERLLEHSRERAHDLAGQIAELQRHGGGDSEDSIELARLRGLVSDYESERARTIEVETTPEVPSATTVADDDIALQGWRLRYFEQRVRYLEGQASTVVAPPVVVQEEPVAPLLEWRARDAEARAQHLEDALRTALAQQAEAAEPRALAAPADEAEPFAANADVDVLLRWRLLYLERRVAHLQAQAVAAPSEPELIAQPEPQAQPLPVADTGPDPDRWKWRARYLEARVRHLEQRIVTAQAVAQQTVQTLAASESSAPPPSRRRGVKPPVLGSARNGAPDDLTLIEGVSPMNHSTLNALGVFHFDQIAAWTPDHVAWVDAYLRLQGRIEDEEWLDQAQALAEEGPAAARRIEEAVD